MVQQAVKQILPVSETNTNKKTSGDESDCKLLFCKQLFVFTKPEAPQPCSNHTDNHVAQRQPARPSHLWRSTQEKETYPWCILPVRLYQVVKGKKQTICVEKSDIKTAAVLNQSFQIFNWLWRD